MSQSLSLYQNKAPSSFPAAPALPRIVEDAGQPAITAWKDFFDGKLANANNTRTAYTRAVKQFLEWCGREGPYRHGS